VLLRESLTSSKITYDDGDKTTTENDLLYINGMGKSTTRAEKMMIQSSRSTSCKIHHRLMARGVSGQLKYMDKNYSEFKHTRLQRKHELV
jgi:hypothetical protein